MSLRNIRSAAQGTLVALVFCGLLLLGGCGSDSGGPSPLAGGGEGETSGPPLVATEPALSPTSAHAQADGETSIDLDSLTSGYVGASAVSSSRLKFQVTSGEMSYNYDLPQDGTPIVCPINMGDGSYTFTIWQNTSESNYVEIAGTSADVVLAGETEPFVRPNVFCSYDPSSACVAKAGELSADAENEGDVVEAVYNWIVDNVDYDSQKAATVQAGYIPYPDATLQSKTGICFDYSSLAAAMLRSQGIPCKIITGYVSPDNIYHAWNMVYIDGTWTSIRVNVKANTWTRIDTTFAAGGSADLVGDGDAYTDRYTY